MRKSKMAPIFLQIFGMKIPKNIRVFNLLVESQTNIAPENGWLQD